MEVSSIKKTFTFSDYEVIQLCHELQALLEQRDINQHGFPMLYEMSGSF